MTRPLHTVYGGAHLFRAGSAARLAELALAHLHRHGKDAGAFARVLQLPPALAETVWDRTEALLRRAAVQDLRIDFEDGFGPRSDAEEDAEADRCAGELVRAHAEGALPPSVGIRVRGLGEPTRSRALRTLDRVLRAAGQVPLVVTVPKVAGPGEVRRLVEALDALERATGRPRTPIELMVEVPSLLLQLPAALDAADGRCAALHLGAYDLTAAIGVPAADQALDHPLCDHARVVMQLCAAGTGVHVVDGATTLLPIGPHRGEALGREQQADNDRVVHEAWRLHARNVRRAWSQGVPQGWDLHPGQIPVRFGVCVGLLLEALPDTTERLRRFLDNAARATRTGATFDDAATGQGLLNTLRTAHASGLLAEGDLRGLGLRPEDLGKSFAELVSGR